MKHRGLLSILVASVMTGAATAHAQGVMVTGATSIQMIDLRPLVVDSVPFSATKPFGNLRISNDSALLTCTIGEAYCLFQRSGSPVSLTAMMQDLNVTAWGLGEGLSVHAQLRLRDAVGDARDLWPQATQTFDALAAYVQIDRDQWHAQIGRQWLTSELGFFNFDGASAAWRATPQLTGELYGGWSLIEGLSRPVTDAAISAVEDLPPDERGMLVGGSLALRSASIGAIRAEYQREIRTDRGALYSERVAVDGELRLGRALASGSMIRDLATDQFDDLTARISLPLPDRFSTSVEARHYVPFFPLWTIWGTFAPVGFDEGRANLQWRSVNGGIMVTGYTALRHYADADAGVVSLPLRTSGWRLGGNGSWRLSPVWSLAASYGADVGFGASRSDADATLHWQPSADGHWSVGLRGAAVQDISEFEVGTGRVLGAGMDAAAQIRPDVRIAADAMVYNHVGQNTPQLANWNQRRVNVRLEWMVGTQAGVPALGGIGGGTPGRIP